MHKTAVAVASATKGTSVGKVLQGYTYIHKSGIHTLPESKRLLLAQALRVAGEYEYDLVKFANDESNVSLLRYPSFDRVAHPKLEYSIKVIFPAKQCCFASYVNSTNPPILHRKDTLVSPEYPHYKKFRALTVAEEEQGLLSRRDIGNRIQWLELLKSKNLIVKGHSLAEVQ